MTRPKGGLTGTGHETAAEAEKHQKPVEVDNYHDFKHDNDDKDKDKEFDEKQSDSRLHSGRTFGLQEPSAWQYLTDNDDHDDSDDDIAGDV